MKTISSAILLTMAAIVFALGQSVVGVPSSSSVNPNAVAVVARADATAQGANIGATTLYAVPASGAGTYRASCYVVITQAATTSATMPSCFVAWTDKDTNASTGNDASKLYANNTVGTNTAALGDPGWSGTLVIQAKASTNIQFQTASYASVGATPMQYAVHVKVEYLGL